MSNAMAIRHAAAYAAFRYEYSIACYSMRYCMRFNSVRAKESYHRAVVKISSKKRSYTKIQS